MPGGRASRRVIAAAAAAAIGLVTVVPAAAPVRGLTDPQAIARALALAYDADFDRADAEAGRACAAVPKPACEVAKAAVLWWRMFLDVDDRSRDAAFKRQVDWAVSQAEDWTKREPDRAEAWLYLGAAYGARSNFNTWRLDFFPVIRDGKRIKQSLEKTLVLDPSLHDAHFGIGLYRYYADMAPTILKFLRWIFFLPGGNKAEGMQQMLRTRDRGVLLRTEAAYQIYQIDIWYEQRIDHARTLLEELRERHPHNPLFLLNLAQLHDVYRNDRPAAMAAYQALVDGAGQGTLREPLLATRWGRRGLAVQHDRLGESDRAVSELQAISAERPMSPHGYLAAVQLDLAQALDRLGRRPQAVAAYQAALAAPLSEGDWEQVRKRAKAGLQTAPPAARGEAWRLSVEGWRAYERRAYAEAAAALDRSLTLAPQDGIAWYRRGVVHEAQGQPEAARAAYERAAQVRPSAPPVFVARALHGAGRLALAAGDVARARGAWDAALAVTGAEPATVEAVRRALAALQAPEISGPRGSSVLETLRVTRVAAGR